MTTDDGLVAAPEARPSFANRLLGWFLLFVVGSAAVNLVVLRVVLAGEADRRLEEALAQEVEELRELARGTDPTTGAPFGRDVQAIFSTFMARNVPSSAETFLTLIDGELANRPLVDPPARLDLRPDLVDRLSQVDVPTRGAVDTEVGRVEYVAVPVDGDDAAGNPVRGTFVVAYFADLAAADTSRALLVVTLTQGAVLTVLAVGVAVWLSRRLTRPLQQLAGTAQQLSSNDLGVRAEVPRDRELAILATTFNQMLDRIEAALESQRLFLADAGHELRTPITIVQGHLDVLGDDPHERDETVSMLQDELTRMGRIVADLSVLASAEQPDFIRPELVAVEPLAGRLRRTVSAIAARRWTVDVAAELHGCDVRVDAERLVQAILAIADNAARHTSPGGAVQIVLRRRGAALRVSVSDDGPGVPLTDRARILRRFVHGERRGSAGLGLSIVASIAEAHGGVLLVDDADVLPGACFTIHLPDVVVGRAWDRPREPVSVDHDGTDW